MLKDIETRLSYQGLNLKSYLQMVGKTEEEMRKEYEPQATEAIKSRLVLEAVVKAENIVATEEDFDNEIAKMAEMYKMEADKVKESIGEEGKKQLMEDLAVSKAVEFVVNEAKEK